jgi:hypothetical protein
MAYDVRKSEVWCVEIDDRPGALVAKLEPLGQKGVDLEFVIARRQPDKPGTGIAFITGIKGAAQNKAAKDAGFSKSATISGLRVEAPNKPGAAAAILATLAGAGINLRGVSATTLGKRFAVLLAFDSPADANTAAKLLKKA